MKKMLTIATLIMLSFNTLCHSLTDYKVYKVEEEVNKYSKKLDEKIEYISEDLYSYIKTIYEYGTERISSEKIYIDELLREKIEYDYSFEKKTIFKYDEDGNEILHEIYDLNKNLRIYQKIKDGELEKEINLRADPYVLNSNRCLYNKIRVNYKKLEISFYIDTLNTRSFSITFRDRDKNDCMNIKFISKDSEDYETINYVYVNDKFNKDDSTTELVKVFIKELNYENISENENTYEELNEFITKWKNNLEIKNPNDFEYVKNENINYSIKPFKVIKYRNKDKTYNYNYKTNDIWVF